MVCRAPRKTTWSACGGFVGLRWGLLGHGDGFQAIAKWQLNEQFHCGTMGLRFLPPNERVHAFDHQENQVNRTQRAKITPRLKILFRPCQFFDRRLRYRKIKDIPMFQLLSKPASLCAAIFWCHLCVVALSPLSVEAQLEKHQQPNATALAKCGVALVMPGYLPAGFQLASFRQDPCPSRMAGYQSVFKGPNRCEFIISGSNGGWGAPGPIRVWKFRSPLLGPIILQEWDGSSMLPSRANYLAAMVTPYNGVPVLPKYPKAGYVFNFSCTNKLFSPETAKQIIMGVNIQ